MPQFLSVDKARFLRLRCANFEAIRSQAIGVSAFFVAIHNAYLLELSCLRSGQSPAFLHTWRFPRGSFHHQDAIFIFRLQTWRLVHFFIFVHACGTVDTFDF